MEIKRIYIQSIPETRFIGKKYGDSDRVGGSFDAKWSEAFGTGLFDTIEKAAGAKRFFEDSGASIGLMRCKEGEPFEYWIGMFTKAGSKVPEGFSFVDFPASELGIVWFYGTEDELFGHEADAANKLCEEGHRPITDANGAFWFFERYQCPRFTAPDENGKVILDIGHFIAK